MKVMSKIYDERINSWNLYIETNIGVQGVQTR